VGDGEAETVASGQLMSRIHYGAISAR
jgi:hypothetical protein